MKKHFTKLVRAFSVLAILSMSVSTALGQYCTATNSTTFEWLSNVNFAGIDNSSGASAGYADYTDIVGTVSPGLSYDFSGTLNLTFSGDQEYIQVWIDWDQSGTFESSERTQIGSFCTTPPSCTLTDVIDVPADALPGETRMRAIESYFSPATNPCPALFELNGGEVEDYTIMVQSGECTPPNITFNVVNDCDNDTYNVTGTINSLGHK